MIDAIIKRPSTISKLVWGLIVFFLYFLGALVYFFAVRKNHPRDTKWAVIVIILGLLGLGAWMI